MQSLKSSLKLTLQMLFVLVVLCNQLMAQGITIGSSTTFTGGSATITLSGNWSNSGTFTEGTSTVIFNGSDGNQTISKTGGESFYNLTVNKSSGDVQLLSNVSVSGTVTLTSGDIDLNGKVLSLGTTGTLSESAGNTVKGTSGTITATRTLNAPASENVAGMGAEIKSTENLGSTVITRGSTPQNGNGNTGITRYFDITPTTNTGLNAVLIFRYDDSELNSLTESELILFKSTDSGNNWTMMGGEVNESNNYVILAGLDGFSRWTLAASSEPLPVELTSFTANVDNNVVDLNWETATEVDNYGFDIERTVSTGVWSKIGFVEGHGNSNSPKQYAFTDKNLIGGSLFKYRLRQIDTDGKFEYSDEIEVEIIPDEFALYQNYPNPFNSNTKIRYQLPRESKVIIKLYDILGSEVITLLNEQKEPGVYEVDFNAQQLSSGTYIYRIVAGSSVETKKMILLR